MGLRKIAGRDWKTASLAKHEGPCPNQPRLVRLAPDVSRFLWKLVPDVALQAMV
jgi:hypothetical protein